MIKDPGALVDSLGDEIHIKDCIDEVASDLRIQHIAT